MDSRPEEVPPEALVKSRQRVIDHGEVFTPAWLVDDMLNLVSAEAERIDSRFLEPACGSGNFLVPVLQRKLSTVHTRYDTNEFDRSHHALFALMCIYGIELLPDNAGECRNNLLRVFTEFDTSGSKSLISAAATVLESNIVQGDALTMNTSSGTPILFPEWSYLGRGKYQRRDFRFESLTARASFQNTLWEEFESHEIFVPVNSYPPLTVEELAHWNSQH